METFREIPWYGKYMVSDLWNVKAFTRKSKWWILRKAKDNYGYEVVTLFSDSWFKRLFKVHRLVACGFLGLDLDSNLVVCHKDDNRSNNCLENLFVWTVLDNIRDMVSKWRNSAQRWSARHNSVLTELQVMRIKTLLKNGKTASELSRQFGVNRSIVSDIKLWKTWKHVN